MTLRTALFLTITLTAVGCLAAQGLFPVKVDKKWGLINADGAVVVQPVYDAIGDFQQYGYAVMQRQGLVGLLGPQGREVLPPRYDDLKVLDASLVAVMDQGEWMVINMQGRPVLSKGYQRLQVLRPGYLAFLQDNAWGVVDAQGRVVSPPRYDEVESGADGYFLTRRAEKLGLLAENGREVLTNRATEIRVLNDSLIFFREGSFWGAVDPDGRERLAPKYDSYRPLGHYFVKLVANGKFYLYSLSCHSLVSQQPYDDFYPFSARYVVVKKERRLGLLDWCGQQVLRPLYQEIQGFDDHHFRVKVDGRWGVLGAGDAAVIPPVYEYISPPRGVVCVIKQNGAYGLVNLRGEALAPARYERIELGDGQAKAYASAANGGAMSLLRFDEEGQLSENGQFTRHFQVRIGGRAANGGSSGTPANDYLLEQFEWFYAAEVDRWGLRRLSDGAIQIEPKFDFVQVEKELGLTVVGIKNSNRGEFERTTFRFDMIYGLVLNDMGIVVTEIDFLDIRLADWRAGRPLARCVFSSGRQGLLDRTGKLARRDLTFVGEYRDGLARVALGGRLSGRMKAEHSLDRLTAYLDGLLTPHARVDYTQYDQLFEQEAQLVCEDCSWGYIDTLGQVVVKPEYSFAQDIANGVGIVSCEGKWGMVDRTGQERIPCNYDGLEFLENTNNRIVRLYVQEPKYGLIDTLGQIRVGAVYEEIGSFSDQRLAVRRNGLWGFVDGNGREVVPCKYVEVQDFSEGLAAVRIGHYWGFIDQEGELRIGLVYRRVGNFRNGLAWAYNEQGTGYIDRNNQFVIPPQFHRAFDFYRGVARVVVDGQFGLIDTSGKYILRPRYTDISEFAPYGLAVASIGGRTVRYGVIDLSGNLITPETYREIAPYHEGLAAVKGNDGYGYIDTNGKLVIPARFSRVGNFSEGRAAVQLDGRCGYIDRTGREVIPCTYSRCQDFSGGRAVVYRGIRNAGIIDLDGRHIVEPSLDRLLEFQEGRGLMRDEQDRFYYITEQTGLYDGFYDQANAFKHGVAVVRIGGKWGIINHKGIEVIAPKYDWIDGFHNGYAKVKIEGFNGLSNLEGDLLVQPNYEYITYAGGGLFRVEQGDQVGYFDASGKWVWELTN